MGNDSLLEIKDKETIIEIGDKCKIDMDKDGNVYLKDCPDLILGKNEIEMLDKIKDLVIE